MTRSTITRNEADRIIRKMKKSPRRLKRAALKSKYDEVRSQALYVLYSDYKPVFADVACNAKDPIVRLHAVIHMSVRYDQDLLQKIAENDEDERVKKEATDKLDVIRNEAKKAERTPGEAEMENLSEALSGYNERVREKAVDRLQSEESLLRCAMEGKTHSLRMHAMYRIKSEEMLARLAIRYADAIEQNKFPTPEGTKYYVPEMGYTIDRIESREILDRLSQDEHKLVREYAGKRGERN